MKFELFIRYFLLSLLGVTLIISLFHSWYEERENPIVRNDIIGMQRSDISIK